MNKIALALLLSWFFIWSNAAHAKGRVAVGKLIFMQLWDVEKPGEERTELDVRVFRQPTEISAGMLQISENHKLLLSFDPPLYLGSVQVLEDGNLATQWSTGLGSYCHLFVFEYSRGRVREVLHTVSDGLAPEFAYSAKGHVMGSFDSPPDYFIHKKIIVPYTEWIRVKGV